ncbi:MAG: hypothetical protein R3A78_12600 [Polyangiales bacterium]
MGLDDGIEFFGGTANVDHLLVTGPNDDGLDWDEGWKGTASFVVVQLHAGSGDNGIEADNLEDDNDASPRSQPTIRNITLIGSNEASSAQRGILFRRGTWGIVENAILMGFGAEAVDVRDEATVMGTQGADPKLAVKHSYFFEIGGADGENWFATEPTDGSDDDDDDGFVESDFFSDASLGNTFGTDPKLTAPYNMKAPDFSPKSTLTPGGAETAGDFNGATYVGAIDPDGDDWTTGWTKF